MEHTGKEPEMGKEPKPRCPLLMIGRSLAEETRPDAARLEKLITCREHRCAWWVKRQGAPGGSCGVNVIAVELRRLK